MSAVLINGSSDALPFGVAVQTTAHRLQLPVLMTAADELPDATAEFISGNDVEHVQIIGGAKLALEIVAIGGTAAVSADVMAAANDAAASSGSLSVSIGATADTNRDTKINADDPVRPGTAFSLYFSDDVAGTDGELLEKVRDIVEVNDVVAQVATATTATITGVCTPRRVDVTRCCSSARAALSRRSALVCWRH